MKTRSPPSSEAPAASPPTTPVHSHHHSGVDSDFDHGDVTNLAGQQLWNPPDESNSIGNRNSASLRLFPIAEVHPSDLTTIPSWKPYRQLETKPISYEKLVNEVTGIYEGLIGVEFKSHLRLRPSVRHLPRKHNMPGRMWRYGIQLFLELLRKRLPGSREHMLTFLAIAYGTMTLQHETIPEFADSWLEYLGHLARYRMAIEQNALEREIWTSASRSWYSKGSELLPEVGRMYHHLGLLAKPDHLRELYYYSKSLCVPVPFPGAWDSIMSTFIPILRKPIYPDPSDSPSDLFDELFVRVNAILLSGLQRDQLEETVARFLVTLDRSIALRSKGWLQSGHCTAISLICSLVGYGAPSNPLQQSLPQPVAGDANGSLGNKKDIDEDTAKKNLSCTDVGAENGRQKLPATTCQRAVTPTTRRLRHARVRTVEGLLPKDWFSSEQIEDEEKMFEPPSLGDERRQRVLWLGRRICELGNWLKWDEKKCLFTVNSAHDRDIGLPAET
ncbi:hypothetical protein ISF_09696 [Cordyceps fumosorosea ARSEF 2679]|uniref:DNA/RNA-binding domain-containing protein n=1 Tax=Cordyceps fumosorosea (strain ARSEF 2679) TaxID=1081104 RepID=A0A167DRX3_CORFA|nr:hypothetical protein ISF_09696 [Cordyceps fumosorosea ARSEF 2679]OAA42780.1 hypothetical protein ISF_09696 [Cordyceps fumosorosea ARSEF 2679]